VLKAAEQFGYVPNELSRGLTSKGVQEVAEEHGYTVFLCSSGESRKAEIKHLEAMTRKRVDGLIIASLLEEVTFDYFYDLKKKGIPFVPLGRIPGLSCDTFEFDDYGGGRQEIEHLLRYGHIRIGFVQGPRTSRAAKLRFEAFLDTMKAHGLAPDPRHVFGHASSLADGMEIGRPLAEMEDSIGVIKAFQGAGHRVPDDLSVVGFDDIELNVFPLTTVSIPT